MEQGQKEAEQKETQSSKKLPELLPVAIVCLVAGVIAGWLVFNAISGPAAAGIPATGFVVLPEGTIGSKTVAYLNDNFLASRGIEAKLASISAYGNAMYSVGVDLYQDGNKLQSTTVYVTQDGNLLLLQSPLNLNEKLPATPAQPEAAASSYKDVQKSNAPLLEAFVVSRCPYGLQMQRILAPAATGLGANIKVRYIGSIEGGKITSMHGDEEAQENLRQICIREEQPDKYWPYVLEYIKKGDSAAALAASKVDTAKLNACVSDSSKGLAYAQEDFAIADAGGVSGSPTLFLNGTQVSEFEYAQDNNVSQNNARSAENLKNLLCYAFSTQPAACSAKLSLDSANTGLSEQYSGGSTSGGSCG